MLSSWLQDVFIHPQGLWLLGLQLPLLALFAIATATPVTLVAAVWLWQSQQARSPPRRWLRLPHSPSYFRAAAALLLLALAAGEPRYGDQRPPFHLSIVVDVSASMSAKEGDASRLDQARAVVRRELKQLPSGAQISLIGAGTGVANVLAPTANAASVGQSLEALSVRAVPGTLEPALKLADQHGRQAQHHRILLLTDRPPPSGGQVPDGLEVRQVGRAAANIALTQAAAQRDGDPTALTVIATVSNFSEKPQRVSVDVSHARSSDTLATGTVPLRPQQTRAVPLRLRVSPSDVGAALSVTVVQQDALTLDNRATVIVPPQRTQEVHLISQNQPEPWIERALRADPEVELLPSSTEEFARIADLPEAMTMTVGWCPPYLTEGSLTVFSPPQGACLGVEVGSSGAKPTPTSWDWGDPRLRFLSFEALRIERAPVLQAPAAKVLLGGNQGPLIVELPESQGLATLVAFPLKESNWFRQTSFVLFIRNLVDMARRARFEGHAKSIRTGEAASLRVPSGVTDLTLTGRGQPALALPVRAKAAQLPRLTQPGIYVAHWGGPRAGSRRLAVNLFSREESDLQTAEAVRVPPVLSQVRPPNDQRSPWSGLLAACAAALLLWELQRMPGSRLRRGGTSAGPSRKNAG